MKQVKTIKQHKTKYFYNLKIFMKKNIYYYQIIDVYIRFQYIDRQLGEDNFCYCC